MAIAEIYLGSPNVGKSDHGLGRKKIYSASELTELHHKGSVANVLCKHCNSLGEVNEAGAKALAKRVGKVNIANLAGKYFTTSSCVKCQAQPDEEIIVRLENIPL